MKKGYIFVFVPNDMFSITRNLSFKAKGNDVALLQDALSEIGYTIDSKEKMENVFGKSTKKAVIMFQSKYGIQATGIVDNVTAADNN